MDDLISRQALKEAVFDHCVSMSVCERTEERAGMIRMRDAILEDIDNAHPVTEVYIVISAELDIRSNVLGVFTDQDEAYLCEEHYNNNGIGSTMVIDQQIISKFKPDE